MRAGEGEIVAFGNMVAGAAACGRVCGGHTLGSDDGYLDMLYTAKNYLRRGVASALCKELEKAVRGDIYADVSKTALAPRGPCIFSARCSMSFSRSTPR